MEIVNTQVFRLFLKLIPDLFLRLYLKKENRIDLLSAILHHFILYDIFVFSLLVHIRFPICARIVFPPNIFLEKGPTGQQKKTLGAAHCIFHLNVYYNDHIIYLLPSLQPFTSFAISDVKP